MVLSSIGRIPPGLSGAANPPRAPVPDGTSCPDRMQDGPGSDAGAVSCHAPPPRDQSSERTHPPSTWTDVPVT